MPGYLEKIRREWAENPEKKADLEREIYGSVIGILEDDSKKYMMEVGSQLFHAGVRKMLSAFNMEVLIIRDPRNLVTKKLPFVKNPANLHEAVIIKGEKRSRLRHRDDRLGVTLRSRPLLRRYINLLDYGFDNVHPKLGPVLTLKDDPTVDDLRIARDFFENEQLEPIFIKREVWARWR